MAGRPVDIVTHARDQLRTAAAGYLDQGDLEKVEEAVKLLRGMEDLLATCSDLLVSVVPDVSPPKKANATRPGGKKRRNKPRSRKKAGEPQFYRSGSQLIKVGQGKAGKEGYEHKASKQALDALITALVGAAAGGEMIRMDALLPLSTKSGQEIPSYQAYLCLAWLRRENLVEQHGRQGYSVANPAALAENARDSFSALPRSAGR